MERRREGVTNEVENEGKHTVVLSSMHFWGGLISVYFFVFFFVDPKSSSHELHCVHLRMVDNGPALVAVGWSRLVVIGLVRSRFTCRSCDSLLQIER